MSTTAPSDPAARLRELGLRVTPQRRVILSSFAEGANEHLTAEEVFDRAREHLPEVARATVYNTLSELTRMGLLRTLEGRGAVRYELDVRDEHHHFRCLACGRVYDVQLIGADDLMPREPGFAVDRAQIVLEGTCVSCTGGG
jgi:Fur family transcriptional regulator, stress-responsive regulator